MPTVCIVFGENSIFRFWVIGLNVRKKRGEVFSMSYRNLKTTEPNLFKLYTVFKCVVLKVCIGFGEIPIFRFFFLKCQKIEKRGDFFICRTVTWKWLYQFSSNLIGCVVLKVCIVFGEILILNFYKMSKNPPKRGGGGGVFNFKMSLPILFKQYILIGCVVLTRLYKSKFI